MILEEIDAIDRRAKSFPRNPKTRHVQSANLNQEADHLEIQIR